MSELMRNAVQVDKQAELRNAAFRGDLNQVISLDKSLKGQALLAGPNSGRNALHWGAFGGADQVVSYLLKAAKGRLDVNAKDHEGNTALHLVLQAQAMPLTKRVAIITLLLAHGANPLLENREHRTPLMYLLPLRNLIASDHPYLREGMNTVISKIKMWIYDKADELKRTVTISPDGQVSFDKTGLPHQDPRAYLAQASTSSLYRSLALVNG